MPDITVRVPDDVERRLRGMRVTKVVEEALSYEAKKRALVALFDERMKGAKQLPDAKLVAMGRTLKKGRWVALKKKRLV